MSWSDRRSFLALGLGGLASACGFEPMQGQGSKARSVTGRIFLPEAKDPDSFAFRERMRRRIGDGSQGAEYWLDSRIAMDETGIAITQASDVTRYRLSGQAEWSLVDIATGNVVLSDTVTAFTGYDATASAYAARSAEKAARSRLAVELAELTAARLTALLNQSDGS